MKQAGVSPSVEENIGSVVVHHAIYSFTVSTSLYRLSYLIGYLLSLLVFIDQFQQRRIHLPGVGGIEIMGSSLNHRQFRLYG